MAWVSASAGAQNEGAAQAPSFFQSGVLGRLERALCRPSVLDALRLKPHDHVLREIALSLAAEIDTWDPEPLYLSGLQLEPPGDLVPGQNRVRMCWLHVPSIKFKSPRVVASPKS